MAIITGDRFNNTLNGTPDDDFITGLGGNDTLNGADGDDILNGDLIVLPFLQGQPGNDTLNGGNGDDILNGGDRDDILNGDDGDDSLFGNADNDTLNGGAGNDFLDGGTGDDTLVGSSGNDVLFGGLSGFDVADYSASSAFNVLSPGLFTSVAPLVIDFANVFKGDPRVMGTEFDQLIADSLVGIPTIESIVGNAEEANFIAARSQFEGGVDPLRFIVDLGAESLTFEFVSDIGPYDSGDQLNTEVVNFENVAGTTNNDEITGSAEDNDFFWSAGNDVYSGGSGGVDTLDYTGIGTAITLKSGGLVDKGAFGQDQFLFGPGPDLVQTIEGVIGDAGFTNVIDANPISGDASINVDLSADSLVVTFENAIMFDQNGDMISIDAGDTLTFTVENFVNVEGSARNDTIVGSDVANRLNGGNGNDSISGLNGNDTLFGGAGNDTLVGGNGNDSLAGGNGNDIVNGVGDTLGATDRDTLRGGAGADTFVLGDATNKFYVGSGFARIADFVSGLDKIQLNGLSSQYNFLGGTIIEIASGDKIAEFTVSSVPFQVTDLIFV